MNHPSTGLYPTPGQHGQHAQHGGPGSPGGPGGMSGYAHGQSRPLTVGDSRLTKMLQREPERCATLSEYARATGIDTGRVMDLFSDAIDAGALAFEPVGPEIFIHTAPAGRPVPPGVPEVAPNLWERLRSHGNKQQAYQLWQLARSMQNAGWVIEANTARIMFSLSPVQPVPELGVLIANQVFPLLIRPSHTDLGMPGGRFDTLSRAGARLVTVVVDSGALDETVTALRRLWLSGLSTQTTALIVEAPRYNPVQVSASDASVAARSVNQLSAPPIDHA